MRLLETTELVFHEYFEEPPAYAILSHTWSYGQEISFQEMQYLIDAKRTSIFDESRVLAIHSKLGYQKILSCCKKAREAEIRYCWIDTCCINKESSSELSEAINSMYHWYAQSVICYVYLEDLQGTTLLHVNEKDGEGSTLFKGIRWMTRSWTLQELIAPSIIIFYNSDWTTVGKLQRDEREHSTLSLLLAKATQIDSGLLAGVKKLEDFSIAQKFSWAAGRSASRIEDESYALLGVLGVNMPLLYGERERAFFRLQQQLLESSDDETLFAWATSGHLDDVPKFGGFLAPSAKLFKGAGNIIRAKLAIPTHSPYHWTNKGLRITLNIDTRFGSPAIGAAVAVLDCVSTQTPRQPLGILVSILDIADPSRPVGTTLKNKRANKLSSSQENFNIFRYLRAPSPVPLNSFSSRAEMAEYLVPVLVHVPQHLSASHTATLQRRTTQGAAVEDFDRGILSMTTISVLLLPVLFVVEILVLENSLGIRYHLLTLSVAVAMGGILVLPRDSIIIRTSLGVWNALLRQR